MEEFKFYKTGWKRNRTEMMHDLLITAKHGDTPTRLMYGTRLAWKPMHEMLRAAEAAGLIEKAMIPPSYSRKTPSKGWKTTVKGLKYAKSVYDNHKLLEPKT